MTDEAFDNMLSVLGVLKFVWFCITGVVGGVTVLVGLYLPGAYTEFLVWLPFLFSFFALGGAFLLINDHKLGTTSWRRVWDVLRAMPRMLQAGLLLAFLGGC